MVYQRIIRLVFLLTVMAVVSPPTIWAQHKTGNTTGNTKLDWTSLPDLPDELGVAGPLVGVHSDALIVAGGANFPRPVWDNDKIWYDSIHVLVREDGGYAWKPGGTLPRPTGYGASVSTPDGVVCIGGNDGAATFQEVFVLRWDAKAQRITRVDYPSLPQPCAYGQAVVC